MRQLDNDLPMGGMIFAPAFKDRVNEARRAKAANVKRHREEADAERAKQAIITTGEMFGQKSRHSWRDIIRMVAMCHGVTFDDIVSPRKDKDILDPRYDAICLIWMAFPNASFPKVGGFFGGRDHSTIFNAMAKRGYRRGNVWEDGNPRITDRCKHLLKAILDRQEQTEIAA